MTKSHRYHPYKHVSSRALAAVHSGTVRQRARAARAVWHSAIGMEVDSASAKRQKRDHEARMIPGLGSLEYGFPNSITTKLRYHGQYIYTSTTGAPAPWIFRANGLFDPDYSNVGHQPLYRDTYANIYDYYVVLGAKITVRFHSNSATSGFLCGIVASDTPTISTTVDTLCEQNNAVHAVIGNISSPGTTLFMTYSPLENLGAQGEDDLSMLTPVGSDPSTTQYFGIWVATSDATTTAGCVVDATVEYTVKFSTLSKPTQN